MPLSHTTKQILLACLAQFVFLSGTAFSAVWPWDQFNSWQADIDASGGILTYSIDRQGGYDIEWEADEIYQSVDLDTAFSQIIPDWEAIIKAALNEWQSTIGTFTFQEVEDNGLAQGAVGAQGHIRITSHLLDPAIYAGYAYYPP